MLCERQRFLPRRSERQARAPPRPAVLRMNRSPFGGLTPMTKVQELQEIIVEHLSTIDRLAALNRELVGALAEVLSPLNEQEYRSNHGGGVRHVLDEKLLTKARAALAKAEKVGAKPLNAAQQANQAGMLSPDE